MTRETGSEMINPELYKGEEDSSKVVNTDFKKASHLNIPVLCSICHEEVHIRQLFHHKRAHQAQATLGYPQPWTETLNVKNLAVRQKQLILRMLNIYKCTEQDIQRINFSFEFLKENLKIAPYFCIDSVEQSSVHTKEVSNPLIKATAICQDRNALWCSSLDDVFVVLDNYGNRPGTCFLGLFDGSNGISAAETTSAELPLLFLDQLSRIDSSYQLNEAEQQVLDSFHTVFREDYNVREKFFTSKSRQSKKSLPNKFKWIHKAYAMSFWRMDRLLRLGRNEVSRIRWSSCSAATCLVEKTNCEKQQQTQEGWGTFRRLSSDNERNVLQQDLPERTVEVKSSTAQQEALIVSNKTTSSINQQAEEPLERINKRERKSVIEDSEHFINNEDRLQGKDQLTIRNSSTQSNEGTAGIIHIANIGNVHIVLCKDGESHWLTKEHTTYSTEERNRVLQNGGHISSNEPKGMVEGVTKTTRGLGYHGNPQLKKTVIPVPHTVSIPVDDSCQFLILASNGLWEVLDQKEVVTLVLIMYSAYLEKYQHIQLQKSSAAKSSKLEKDFKENYFSWYLMPDIFSEKDLEDNLQESDTRIRVSTSSGLVEEETISSGSLVEYFGKQKLKSPSKEGESCIFTISTPDDTEITSSSSGSQTSFEKIKVSDEDQASTDNQESSSQIEETDAMAFYAHVAKYICKHLVKAALRAGSRDNITVLVTLLNGCDKIPTYV